MIALRWSTHWGGRTLRTGKLAPITSTREAGP
jgi:hypothetical protein